MDHRLLAFIEATDEDEADRCLASLIDEHAVPIVKEILGSNLRFHLDHNAAASTQDANDLFNEIIANLLARLRQIRNDSSRGAIADWRGYIAATGYNACNLYLRQKYPRRARLKNRLRYLLSHDAAFALWTNERSGLIGGLAHWRDESEPAPQRAFEKIRQDPVEWIHGAGLQSVSTERAQLSSILQALFKSCGGAIKLDDLVNIVADVPGVGENLQDHFQARTIVRLKKRMSMNDAVRNPFKLAGMGFEWLVHRSGPLTVGAGQVGGAACTEHAVLGRPDVQFNVMPLSVDKPGDPLHAYPGFTAAVWQCHPQSRGRLRIRSRDPAEAPIIEPRYLDHERDRRTLVAGIRMLREIYAQPSFSSLYDVEVLPGTDAKTDEALLQFARNTGGTVFHCVGTCRMGAANDSMAVVDPDLRVRNVERLRVIDASVMPIVTSANTNAASLMIGERGARTILGRR